MNHERRLEKVFDIIETQYYIALDDKKVRCPMAYALYNVWKMIDKMGW